MLESRGRVPWLSAKDAPHLSLMSEQALPLQLSPALAQALAALDELVDWERRDRSDMQRTLAPVEDVLERLGNPHHAWQGVLVAGTKGKGSVASMVAAGLARAGLLVGLYTSPHVERVTERVVLGGEEVADNCLAAALDKVLTAREAAIESHSPGAAATWFDCLTAAAFVCFEEAGVDWAVVEVGIGGRLDSTRVVEASVALVTGVDLEHTATLGDTRRKIATEKGAVVANKGVLLTGVSPRGSDGQPDEAWEALEEVCSKAKASLVSVGQNGSFEERNLALATATLAELGRGGVVDQYGAPLWRSHLDETTVRSARLPARDERFLVAGVQVVLDGGHVASSIEALLDRHERDPELGKKPKLLLALGLEKDAHTILKALQGRVDRCLCTTLLGASSGGRFFSDQALAEVAHEVGHDPEAWDDPREALTELLSDAASGGGWVLICGSFYLAGLLRPLLRSST
ncbi:MAG TPA: bifunctional folylpolyglutamate synthase/dihydrofolate synthase [Planctomycetes bacterium]|nr:bifunctional folylpolyglutamate synthase/dihydrofolate synthase [Planctomycetota bacterium]HIL50915.1 bifunctional folylpolyglutamate synthase/dihydrofolate synthase [Planctomycetota bacterium]